MYGKKKNGFHQKSRRAFFLAGMLLLVQSFGSFASAEQRKPDAAGKDLLQKLLPAAKPKAEKYPAVFPLNGKDKEEFTFSRDVRGKVDLDFDGVEEELNFVGDYQDESQGWKIVRGSFQINGKKLNLKKICRPLSLDGLAGGEWEVLFYGMDVIDLDPTDKQRELVIFKTLHSGVPYHEAELFHYRDGKIKSLGEISAGTYNTFMDQEEIRIDQKKNLVTLPGEEHMICNFFYPSVWKLEKGKIRDISGEELQMYRGGSFTEQDRITVKAIGSLDVYGAADWKKVIYRIKPGDKVTFLSCRPGLWVKVRVGNKSGFLKFEIRKENAESYERYILNDDPSLEPTEIFEDLPLWG